MELSVERISGGYYQASEENIPSPDYPSEIETVGSNINLCNGINQGYYLNFETLLCGLLSGNNGLIIPTTGGKYTISTQINQTRYRVACINEKPIEGKTVTAYKGVNKDGTSKNITIDTSGYAYLIINATDLTKIKIEKGSIATPYSPYGMGSVGINVVNKNLFDKDNAVDGYRIGSDGLPFTDKNNAISQYIKVKPDTTYYTNFKLIWSNCIAEYTKDKIFILRNQSELNKFTTSNNCEYIRITCLITQKDKLQLEQGFNATDYERHQSQTAIMPIQQEMLERDYVADVEHHEWGKIESYNNEEINTEYISTTGELSQGATVYYKLETPVDLELTEEQKAVRNQKLYTYKNITNISLSDELASIDIEYKKDLETMFNNIIKQMSSSTSDTTET